jgi:arylformamidase
MTNHRVEFDFEVEFTNGGNLRGQGFRLDIPGADISDGELADLIVADLRLLMAGEVRIHNKRILVEAHKRPDEPPGQGYRLIELSHRLQDGLVTYRGLPALRIDDHLSREASRSRYAAGTEFHIAHLDMVANTGTYLDVPFHRYPEGKDPSQVELRRLVDLPGVAVRAPFARRRAIGAEVFRDHELRGRAVLVDTGWSTRWGTESYFEGHPFLTEEAARYLTASRAALVGIDSMNIDDTSGGSRPVHTLLLGADIPIVEHLCHLDQLPDDGFTFTAAPPLFRGIGSFPVRAYARCQTWFACGNTKHGLTERRTQTRFP